MNLRTATLDADADGRDGVAVLEASPLVRGGAMKFQYASGSRPLEGYTIKRGVGKGGFGEVYFATSDAGKEVALKHIERNLEVELRGVGQCLNLKHANLVDLHDIRYDEQGEAWVVMEYIAGSSLKDALDRNPNGLPVADVESWFRGIAAGVAYLHDHGIVHRDLKPGNIFEDDGVVKIGDYGLSKFISCSRRSGQTESVGTFHYMAPEIGKGVYGKEIDTYALGIMLYEMLTGHVPFEGESSQEIIMKHLTADPDLSAAPQPYRAIIERALRKDPEKRFKNVAEMVALLDSGLAGTQAGNPKSPLGAARSEAPAPAPSQFAGGEPPIRVAAKVAVVKDSPLYIGDDEKEMSFGPVKQGPPKHNHASAPMGRPIVPGSFAALAMQPRTEEPIFSAAKSGWSGFVRWWHQGSGGTGLKIALLVSLAVAFLFAGPWLIPIGIALGTVYAVYLGIWLVVQALSGPSTPLPASPIYAANGYQGISWEQQYRGALRMKTLGDRVGELAGSMLASAAIAAVLTVVMSAIGGGSWIDASAQQLSGPAWLWLTTVLGSWTLLIAGKFWEANSGEQVKRRFALLVIGLIFGAVTYATSQYMLVQFGRGGSASHYADASWARQMLDATGQPRITTYLAYFGLLFLAIGWWKQTDPLRTSRLRIAPVLLTLLLAAAMGIAFPFPQPWGFLIAAAISVTVQLSSPWLKPQERLAIRQRVVSEGRV